MALQFSASRAPSSTAGLFKSAPKSSGNFMNSGKSYEQYYYDRALKDSRDPSSMSYGEIPWKPGQSWNDWRAEQRAFEDTYTGPGIATARAAASQRDGLFAGGSKPRAATGGSGGGVGGMMIQQAPPLDFFRGLAPEMEKLDIPLEEYSKMLGKVNNPEELAALSERYNAPTKKAFESNMPFFDASLAALGGQALDALQGRVSRSTAQSVARSVAQANLGSGLAGGIMGAMGGLGRNMVFRDLAKASEAAVDRGINALGQSLGFFQQKQEMASPISMSNLMVNPAAIYDTLITQAQNNQNIANANLMNAWQSQALPGQFDIKTGSYVGYQPGSRSATRPLTPDQEQRIKDLKAAASTPQLVNQYARSGWGNIRGVNVR
jgi:hypothetical protein